MLDLNTELLKYKIQGGKPVKEEFPELGETSLMCTTELHTRRDIDRLVEVLAKITEGKR
jgi:glycine dehydrogenase subunit 1